MDGEGGLDVSSVEEDGVEVVAGAAAGPDFLDTGAAAVAASGALVGADFLVASGALAGVVAFGDSAGASAMMRVATARM